MKIKAPPTDAPATSVAAMKIKASLPRATATTMAPAAVIRAPSLSGKLVFQTATGRDLYIIRADGSGLTRLTQGGLEPSLSPDGTRVAFTRWGDGEGLYTIRTDGTDERLVFRSRQPRQPAWSPDGSRLAFSFQKDSQQVESHDKSGKLYRSMTYFWRTAVVGVDGTGFTELPTNSDQSFSPTWSPDGTRVAFAGNQGLVVSGWDGFYRELTHGAWHQSPAWSPDGKSIAFSIKRDNHFDLFLRAVGPDLAAEQTALTTNKGLDLAALTSQPMYADGPISSVSPTWSPDGQYLAFLTNRDGRWEIYVMKPDGSEQRPLFGAALDGLGITYEFANEKSLDWGR
jgi:Tol biopolymer transport system component